MITVNAQNSFKKKRRKRSPFDVNFVRTLESIGERERVVDEFYSFWEYLNDVARVAEKRLMTALMAQLTTIFWHPTVCAALSSPSAETATSATAYTTEMIRSLTDQRLLHVFLVVLLGEDGGIGKDIEPEVKTYIPIQDLIDDDKDDESSNQTGSDDEATAKNSIEDDISSTAPPTPTTKPLNTTPSQQEIATATAAAAEEEWTLRLLLINRIDAENHELALATLRMFDTIMETYNQFAIYNLVLRNYLDISPDGEYIEDEVRDVTDTSSLGSRVVDNASVATVEEQQQQQQQQPAAAKVDDLAIGDSSNKDASTTPNNSTSTTTKKENKTEKVRWLVER